MEKKGKVGMEIEQGKVGKTWCRGHGSGTNEGEAGTDGLINEQNIWDEGRLIHEVRMKGREGRQME